jgi:hypothetical protein
MSAPSKRISPARGGFSPMMLRSSVVLPADLLAEVQQLFLGEPPSRNARA